MGSRPPLKAATPITQGLVPGIGVRGPHVKGGHGPGYGGHSVDELQTVVVAAVGSYPFIFLKNAALLTI